MQLLLSSDLSSLVLLDPLMENMTSRLKDSSVTVRMLAVRGLGNIANGYPEKVSHPTCRGRGLGVPGVLIYKSDCLPGAQTRDPPPDRHDQRHG